MEVAETILRQIGGGNRLRAMIGASGFIGSDTSLSFKWKAKAKNGANALRIVLDPSDTYTMHFYKLRAGKATELEKFDDIYSDMLREVFEDCTGLYLRM
jgi:hypothetical protein